MAVSCAASRMASGKARQRDGVAYARTLYCGTITPISTANAPPRGIRKAPVGGRGPGLFGFHMGGRR